MTWPGRRALREAASDEIERVRTKVMTLGFAFADAVQAPAQSAIALADGLLGPARPAVAVRGLVAFWIESLRSSLTLCRQLAQLVSDPVERPGPLGAVAAGQVRFFVPVGSEATDPLALPVALDQVGAIQVLGPPSGPVLPPANVYVSVSSTGSQAQVALIGLDSIADFQQLGSQCRARLQVPDGRTLDIIATRS